MRQTNRLCPTRRKTAPPTQNPLSTKKTTTAWLPRVVEPNKARFGKLWGTSRQSAISIVRECEIAT